MIRLTATAQDLPKVLEGAQWFSGAIQWSPQQRPKFFRRDALVPRYEQSRPLTDQIKIDKGNVSWAVDAISVVSIERGHLDRWMDFWNSAKRMHPSQIYQHVSGVDLLKRTTQELVHQLKLKNDVRSFGFCVNYPSMLTTTVDRQRGEICGLHFDSWESATLAQRRKARKRLAVNLGPGPRWFLFSPHTCEELARRAGLSCDDEKDPTQQIVEALRINRQTLECIALRLEPGQAYLAATDYLLHDATSYWGCEVNYSVQYLVAPESSGA